VAAADQAGRALAGLTSPAAAAAPKDPEAQIPQTRDPKAQTGKARIPKTGDRVISKPPGSPESKLARVRPRGAAPGARRPRWARDQRAR